MPRTILRAGNHNGPRGPLGKNGFNAAPRKFLSAFFPDPEVNKNRMPATDFLCWVSAIALEPMRQAGGFLSRDFGISHSSHARFLANWQDVSPRLIGSVAKQRMFSHFSARRWRINSRPQWGGAMGRRGLGKCNGEALAHDFLGKTGTGRDFEASNGSRQVTNPMVAWGPIEGSL